MQFAYANSSDFLRFLSKTPNFKKHKKRGLKKIFTPLNTYLVNISAT